MCVTLSICVCVRGVILCFLLTAAGCEQIYSVADAVEGHSPKFVLYHLGHLFMGWDYTIGRLSKLALGNKNVAGRVCVCVRVWEVGGAVGVEVALISS